jgi:glycogen(starch) synthase
MDGERRHVLMTVDAVGGVWTYALDLAAGLASAGIRTSLAVLGPSPARDQLAEAAAVPDLALIDTGLPLDWTAADADSLSLAAKGTQSLADELNVDLVHLNAPALGGAAHFTQPVISVAHSCLATWWSGRAGRAAAGRLPLAHPGPLARPDGVRRGDHAQRRLRR